MKISLDITDILLLAFVVQGLVLSGMLIFAAKRVPSNLWIGLFIFVVSESTLLMELDISGLTITNPNLLYATVPLELALGPLIFLYVRSLVYPGEKLKGSYYLNFLPVVIGMKHQFILLLYVTGILALPFIQRFYFMPATQIFLFGNGSLMVLFALIVFSVYAVVSYKIIVRRQKDIALGANKLVDLKWTKRFLHFVFAFILLWLVSIIFHAQTSVPSPWMHYIIYLPAVLFAYWIGMTTYVRQYKMPEQEMVEYAGTRSKAYFTEAVAHAYQQQIVALMETEHVYLNPLLKLDIVASRLSISEKQVSNLLNQHIGKNFNDFVNEYRVNEAKRKLADPACRHFTISAIGYDCGFNSLATFQRVFKQVTGLTPSQYQGSRIFPIE